MENRAVVAALSHDNRGRSHSYSAYPTSVPQRGKPPVPMVTHQHPPYRKVKNRKPHCKVTTSRRPQAKLETQPQYRPSTCVMAASSIDTPNDEPQTRKKVKFNLPEGKLASYFDEKGLASDESKNKLDETTDNIPDPSAPSEASKIWNAIDEKWFTPLACSDFFVTAMKVSIDPLEKDQIQEEIDQHLRRLDTIIANRKLNESLSLPRLLKFQGELVKEAAKYVGQEASQIKDILQFNSVVRSLAKGFADKSQLEVFARFEYSSIHQRKGPVGACKSKISGSMIDTECKVCFNCSAESQPCNTIIYCDKCGTSFHQYCYGMQYIPPPNKQFLCDCCEEYKAMPNKPKQPCRICLKANFPMRKLQGHYYHVTCLFLNNLVTVREGKLQLKEKADLQYIDKLIAKAEENIRQDNGFCEYCVNCRQMRDGLQVQCSHTSCKKWFHPICAYLNGCEFSVSTKEVSGRLKLGIMVHCKYKLCYLSDHDVDRDHRLQTYLRRYSLNLSGAFSQTFAQFDLVYGKREVERQANNYCSLKELNRLRAMQMQRAITIKVEEQAFSDEDA